MPTFTHRPLERFAAPAGAAVLALTAADWLVRSETTTVGTLQQQHSLWGMLGVVNPRYAAPAYLAVIVIVLFAIACFIAQRTPGLLTSLALLSTAATAGIMIATDNHYSSGEGAWLTGLISIAVALAGAAQIVQTVHRGWTAR